MARMQADPRDNFLSYTTLTRSPPSVNASFAPHANVVMSPTQEYKEYTTVQARTNAGAVWSPHRQYASSYVQSPVIQVRIQMVAHASAWAGFMLYGAVRASEPVSTPLPAAPPGKRRCCLQPGEWAFFRVPVGT